ncbi:MAG: putative porin, partial [Vicingaceae bacterium]
LLKIDHYQEIAKNVFFDLNFKRLSSPGAFVNQESNRTSFSSNIKVNSNDDKYTLNLFMDIDRIFFQENGGLANINNYELRTFDDEQNYQVNLLNSSAFNKAQKYGLSQSFNLFQFKADSNLYNNFYLKHNFSYSSKNKVFYDNDPLSNIYKDLFIDSISYTDSIFTDNISNVAFLGFSNTKSKFELFGQYDLNKYDQNLGIFGDYHNSYIGVYGKHDFKNITVFGTAKYGLSGYRKGDIDSEIIFKKQNKKNDLVGRAYYFLNEPNLKFVSYTSNHFSWKNTSLYKESNLGLNLKYELKKTQLTFAAETKFLRNKLYYDTLALASQFNEGINVSTLSLEKQYKLLNFHFRTAIMYQITSDEYIAPLPEFVGRQILYYQKQLFKEALKFQIGFGVSYSTSYYGYAYMPAINEFYIQNNTKLGEYPKLDVFINTHLKRAQIFLKYEHVNAGGSLDNAYLVPGYPMLNKSLKFGVSWNMFD